MYVSFNLVKCDDSRTALMHNLTFTKQDSSIITTNLSFFLIFTTLIRLKKMTKRVCELLTEGMLEYLCSIQ